MISLDEGYSRDLKVNLCRLNTGYLDKSSFWLSSIQSTLHDVPSLSQKTVYTVVCCLVYKNHVYNTDFLFQLRRGLCSRFFIAVPSPNYSTERKTALAYQQKLPTLLCVTFGLWASEIKEMKEKKESNQESNVGLRWKVRLSIVISGMFFNGVIYGYTSPALPSFQQQEKHQKNIFDELFPK